MKSDTRTIEEIHGALYDNIECFECTKLIPIPTAFKFKSKYYCQKCADELHLLGIIYISER